MSDRSKELKLLLLRDCAAELENLKVYLDTNDSLLDVEYREVASEREAHELMRSWKPTTVIVDAYLETGDSLGFLDSCRDSSASLVLTSRYYSRRLNEAAFEHGAQAYLAVGDDPDYLEQFFEKISELSAEKFVEH